MDDLEPIPLSALQHWAYCPRPCGLLHLEQAFDDNLHTLRGQSLRGAVAETAAAVQQQPIARMVLESTVSLPAAAVVALVNGTYEEVFLLGFLTRGLRGHGLGLAVGASLAVRVLCHTYQGPLGLLSVLAFALIVTAYFVQTGRLWPAVVCHMAADFVPLAT